MPELKLLESRLAPGALIASGDINLDSMMKYLQQVRDPANGHISAPPAAAVARPKSRVGRVRGRETAPTR